LARPDGDFQATGLAVPMALKPDVLINKSGKRLNGVQKGLNLQLHGWSAAPGSIDFSQQRLISPRPAFFNPLPSEIFALPFRCGWEDKALQECSLSAQPPWIALAASPPARVKVSGRIPLFGMPLQATAKAKNSSLLPAVRPLFSPRLYPQILLQTRILELFQQGRKMVGLDSVTAKIRCHGFE
jgi:hypothetical protein